MSHNKNYQQHKQQAGFTLIELIVGIIVLTISLAVISTLIAPAEEKSADNVLQIKASELAQSLMNDITSRAFDHHADMSGGFVRCDETGGIACTSILGPENGVDGRIDAGEDERNKYNDVDDFDQFSAKVNSTDGDLDSGYSQFIINVRVVYAGEDLGLTNRGAKRITVTVTTPLGTAIEFTSHKVNF